MMEMDFTREARNMDTAADCIARTCPEVVVPTSVPGLVAKNVIVMSFLPGMTLPAAVRHSL